MSLPRLKSLRLNLEAIWFYEDEKLMNSFFSSFPSLESLAMDISDRCDNIKNLTVSLPKLKYFVWHHDSNSSIEVKLHAPSLLSLIIRIYYGSTSFALENLSSLVTADIGPVPVEEDQVSMMRLLRGIHTVEVLELNDSFIAALSGLFSEAPNISDTQLPKFHNLQRLELETCFLREYLHTIICILKNSHNIESFSLCNLQPIPYFQSQDSPPYCDEVKFNSESIGDCWEADWEAALSLPNMLCHLKVVKIIGNSEWIDEVKFLVILFKHAVVLEKVVLATMDRSTKQDSLEGKRMKKYSEMLLKFPGASQNINILFEFFVLI